MEMKDYFYTSEAFVTERFTVLVALETRLVKVDVKRMLFFCLFIR